MTYYIIRRGTHENHGNNISSISWLEWESREKEEVIKAYFNELAEEEGISWQLVRVDVESDAAKSFTKETIEQEINPCGFENTSKTNWLYEIQKDGRTLETYPHQSIAEKRLLELLRTDETSAGWYSIRRIQMDDSIVAQYKKEGARI